LEAWAKNNNITFTGRKGLIAKSEVQKLFEAEIGQYMKDYSRVEQIRKFTLLEAEWSQATGELTPTMKLKRTILNQKYRAHIESMYPPE
jgi:long-chain acyl-CoA synthetase